MTGSRWPRSSARCGIGADTARFSNAVAAERPLTASSLPVSDAARMKLFRPVPFAGRLHGSRGLGAGLCLAGRGALSAGQVLQAVLQILPELLDLLSGTGAFLE